MFSFLGFLAGTASVMWVINHFALAPWRRANVAHWTERARQLYPARHGHGTAFLLMPGIAALAALWPALGLSPGWAAAGAYFGVLLAGYSIDGAVFPEWGFLSWLGFATTITLYRMLGWAALIAGIVYMPQPLDARACWIVAGYLAVRIADAAGVGNVIWRWSGLARPASPRLANIVAEASAQCGVRPKGVWELAVPMEYAAALVVTKNLVFSTVLLEHHDDEAIKAITAHELAHLAEPAWATIIRVMEGPISWLPLLFILPVYRGPAPATVIVLLCAPFWIKRLYARFSLRFEKEADRHAVQQTPDPAVYAQALEQMHQWNLIPVVMSANAVRTHPDHYDRMLAAGVEPDYPRPEAPNTTNSVSVALQVILGLVVGLALAVKVFP